MWTTASIKTGFGKPSLKNLKYTNRLPLQTEIGFTVLATKAKLKVMSLIVAMLRLSR